MDFYFTFYEPFSLRILIYFQVTDISKNAETCICQIMFFFVPIAGYEISNTYPFTLFPLYTQYANISGPAVP